MKRFEGNSWRMVLSATLAVFFCFAGFARAKTSGRVGIWLDGRTGNLTGLTETLEQAGYSVTNLNSRAFNMEAIKDLDVLLFTGGWGAYQYLKFESRKAVVDFVAQGKGVMVCAFRGGYVRTTNRPLFPRIGAGYNRVSSNYVFDGDKHPLLEGMVLPWCHRGWDHILMKPGPDALIFLKDATGEPVGICGEPFGGRYVAVGTFLAGPKKPLEGNDRALLLNGIKWCAGADRLHGKTLEKSRSAAELVFLKQERTWDYTHDERGPDSRPGLIPRAYDMIQTELDMWLIRLLRDRQTLGNAANPELDKAISGLEAALKKLDRNYGALLKSKTREIQKADAASLLADDPEKAVGISERLLPRKEIDPAVKTAEKVHSALAAVVEKARQARALEARNKDIASVPSLIERCASSDALERREASLELGRIGDPRSVKILTKLLNDPDRATQRNAILALGWMQSREAVPSLIKLAKGRDKWARRRAVQALGQIGDRSATKTLIETIDHPDYHTAGNAVLALGWLGDPSAVSALMKVVEQAKEDDTLSSDKACSAIRALGYIGDKQALPLIEPLARGEDKPSRGLDTKAPVIRFAKAAVESINVGGRKKVGIKQPEYLASKDRFYALRRQLNFFVGRCPIIMRSPQFKRFPEAFFDYMHAGGATAFLSGWSDKGLSAEEMDRYLGWAAERDMKWITDLPMEHHAGKVQKAGCELLITKYSDEPAFGGFWSEENYPVPEPSPEEFQAFLQEKYGNGFRKKLGLAGKDEIKVPDNKERLQHKKLWAEYLDMGGRQIVENWREAQEWMHGLRKACAFTFSITSPQCMSHLLGVYPKLSEVIDLHGPESYASGGPDMSFLMDLIKDGQRRPVLCEFYNWYTPNPGWAERGYALHLMHGEAFYNFYIGQMFKHAPDGYPIWTWGSDRWAAAERVFLKGRRIGEYIGHAAPVANVALLYSDRTSELFSCKGIRDRSGRERRYHQHQQGLWQAINQAHIPLDSIWVETMTPEKLARYRVLVLSDAKSLTTVQETMLRNWVKQGGYLLATGSTSLFDEWGRQKNNYGLAEVFGVDYSGHVEITDPAKSDSFCFVDGLRSCEKIAKEGFDPDSILHFVHREVKPEKSLTTFRVVDEDYAPSGVSAGAEYEYDLVLGYDRVKPGKAKTIAEWKDGDPAITVNKFGEGTCVFWTEVYPGLSHTVGYWEMHPLYKRFWPGVQELVSSLILGGLENSGSQLPVTVTGCPGEVEVSVRAQPEKNRWMVHFLNYDPNLESVKSFKVAIHPPSTKGVRLFYPVDGERVKAQIGDAVVRFDSREFAVHDIVVVEWE